MKCAKGILIAVATLMLMACTKDTSVIKLDNDKRCRPLKVHPDQEIEISLEGNPSTGYSWLIVNQPHFLTLIKEAKEDTSKKKNIVGKPVTMFWRYQVHSKGEGCLRFTYQRPWETDQVSNKTFNCKIVSE